MAEEREELVVVGSEVVEVPLTEVEPEMIDEKVISVVSLFRHAVARSCKRVSIVLRTSTGYLLVISNLKLICLLY